MQAGPAKTNRERGERQQCLFSNLFAEFIIKDTQRESRETMLKTCGKINITGNPH